MAEHEALRIGQTFAERYRVEKFLAKGGFGAVYIAEQIETELKVALKVLWPHVLHSDDAVEKFRLEARVAGRVGSEHIVKVFDAGFDAASGMPFLVMELLHGSELDKLVQTQGPLAPARVVSYFRQIASGLDKAHGYVTREGVVTPIVHRDLKPENLFLAERETGEPVLKILDFGIAKVLSQSTQVSQEVKGTPLYMSFEQVAAGKITPQTDIWPLGLIAFYLLTGKAYWKAANHNESTITMLFGEVLSLPIELASERARQIGSLVTLPPAFDAWFSRCVEREPARRFKTAGECAQALAQAFGSAAVAGAATLPSAGPDSSGAVAARTLGNTTATPIVSQAGLVVLPKRGGGLKWVLAALAVVGVAGAFTATRLREPTTATADSAIVTPTAPQAAAASTLVAPRANPPEPSPPATTAATPSASGAPALPAAIAAAGPRPAKPNGPPTPATSPKAAAATPTPAATAAKGKPVDVYGDR